MERKVLLFIAMSLDGYIAKHDDNIDFLSMVERPDEDYGYEEFQSQVDTVIWGRKTFDTIVGFGEGIPHKDKKVYVVSKSRTGDDEHATYHNDVVKLVEELKSKEGKDIYCDGGAEIVTELLNKGLIDRMIVSIVPHLLGDGIRLFRDGREEQDISFKRSVTFPSGLVQLWYDIQH